MTKEEIKKEFGIIPIKEEHFNKFNKYPLIIGIFWNKPDILIANMLKAIEDNKPYNEYELLSDEEKKSFDNGKLLF